MRPAETSVLPSTGIFTVRTSNLVRHLFSSMIIVAIPLVAAGQDEPAAPILLKTYQDLLDLLNHDSVLHKADNEKMSATMPTKRKDLDGVMIIRWQQKDGVVQFIQTMPIDIPEARVAAVETAMMRLNHAMAVPGFSLDHTNRMAYFRMVVPFQPRGFLQDNELRAYFQVTLRQAAEFYDPLKRVAAGADPVAVVEEIRRAAQERKAAEQDTPPTT
jgi:hypothetical protein